MRKSLKVHVAAGAVVIHGGKVLLVRINKPKDKNGLWGFPGGKLDKGESLEEGMMRELYEETGIKSHLYDYHPLGIIHEKAEATCKHVYLVKLKQDVQHFSYDLSEILEIRWVSLDMATLKDFSFRSSWIAPFLEQLIANKLPASGLPLYQ